MFYTNLPHKKINHNIQSMYKSDVDPGEAELNKADIISLEKGRRADAIGTRKKWGNQDYVKTAQGWKANAAVKDAHDKIHAEKKDEMPEGYHPKVWQHSMKTANDNKKWAENKNKELGGKEWAEASEVSKNMLKEYSTKSVHDMAKHHYDYFKMRSHAMSGGYNDRPIDPSAHSKWTELTGKEPETKKK